MRFAKKRLTSNYPHMTDEGIVHVHRDLLKFHFRFQGLDRIVCEYVLKFTQTQATSWRVNVALGALEFR